MTDYVVGFMHSGRTVVLIKKERPEWQAGMVNGIGGKIEINEDPKDAMIREFEEEAGVQESNWRLFLLLRSGPHRIYFFESPTLDRNLKYIATQTDEEIMIAQPSDMSRLNLVPNLRWIIPLAVYKHDQYRLIDVSETK